MVFKQKTNNNSSAIALLLLWLSCICSSTVALSQSGSQGRLFRNYSSKEGLIMNSVYSLEKSSNGLLWVGTPGGLQRFDGYGFDNWDQSADSTKKTGLSVYHIREDSRKNIWVFNTASAFVFPQGKKLIRKYPSLQHSLQAITSNTSCLYKNLATGFGAILLRDI
ncbi:MAG: hypothetical protein IPP79_16780 [Chitinophagaceae bacterium]|nr:hypothetical protein [Chitinophagaceae bacterium]